MLINFKWSITTAPTEHSIEKEKYFSQKNIFATITVDCTNGVNTAVLEQFADAIMSIVGSPEHCLSTMVLEDGETKIARSATLLIRKDLVDLLMSNTSALNKKGFILVE